MIILAYAIVTFALIGLLSNFFFVFFMDANDKLNKDEKKTCKSKRQKDQDFKSDMYAQDTMKIELPEKYKNYPSHLADLEA